MDHLLERVLQAAELLKRSKEEKRVAEKEIERLRRDLQKAKRESQIKDQVIERLENDRLKIRSRVEKVLEQVSTLEE